MKYTGTTVRYSYVPVLVLVGRNTLLYLWSIPVPFYSVGIRRVMYGILNCSTGKTQSNVWIMTLGIILGNGTIITLMMIGVKMG